MISYPPQPDTAVLSFGKGESLRFELPPKVLVGSRTGPRAAAVGDVFEATRTALAAPLGFPPLEQVAFPGDRVVIAVGPGVSQGARVVAAIVASLRDAGVSSELISVLTARGADGLAPPELTGELSPEDRASVTQVVHDPQRSRDLCRIGESRSGRPLVVHRLLFDADLVISVGAIEASGAMAYFGVYSPIYPTMADAKTQRRFRAPCLFDDPQKYFPQASGEAAEAAWILGARFVVQVVPGAGDEILSVLAGDGESVEHEGRKRFDEAWNYEAPQRAQLVVASLDGAVAARSWDALARALAAAARLATDDGVIAIASAIDAPPGAALESLARTADAALALRRIRKKRSDDMPAAEQLARALERGRVYLLSRLAPEFVEDLGAAPVSQPSEIARLAARSESCILLGSAQHVVATAAGE